MTPGSPALAPALVGVCALVLAAGGSSRFGEKNKLLHVWRDKSLLDHVLDALDQAPLDRVLVVTGHDVEAVQVVLANRPFPPATVHNRTWRRGLASSLACGISALVEQPAVLVCLGDMPLVDARVIEALLDGAKEAPDRALVFPVSDGRRGNPVLVRHEVFDQLLALDGGAGARVIAERHPELTLYVEVGGEAVLRDVDTPFDAASLGI